MARGGRTIMNRQTAGRILCASVLVAAAGCIPEKRIVWSPDGSRATVIASDGLRMCSPDGTLSNPLLPEARRVAWFPDSKRLLVIHVSKAKNWAEVERIIDAPKREAIATAAKELRGQVLAFSGQ